MNETMEKRARRRVLIAIVIITILVIISIVTAGGCGTLAGLQSDIHQVTRPAGIERGQ